MIRARIIEKQIAANGVPPDSQLVSIDSQGDCLWGEVVALPRAQMEERAAKLDFSTYGMVTGEEFLLQYREQLDAPEVAAGPVTPFCLAPPRKKKW